MRSRAASVSVGGSSGWRLALGAAVSDPAFSEDRVVDLDRAGEREVLALLEEALGQPPAARRRWLAWKLGERAAIGRRVAHLLSLVEPHGE